MKKFFLLLFGITFLVAKAQTKPLSYFERMKILTKTLDSSKFLNNILYDRVFPISNLINFNQGIRKDTSNYEHFSQVIYELNLLKNDFAINNQILDNIKYAYSNQNICPVGIINLDFTIIDENAFDTSNPKMIIDSTNQQQILKEVPNTNPYVNKHTIVIAPLVKKMIQENQPIVFSFDKLYYEMSINQIKDLQLTFENNETFNIISNQNLVNPNITHLFQNSGQKILKFTGHFSDNQYFETYGQLMIEFIDVVVPNTSFLESEVQEIVSNELFTPYEPENDAPYTHIINADNFPKMKFKVYYGTNKNKLRKPIIIIDGIDYDYDGYHGTYLDYDIDEIYQSINYEPLYYAMQLRALGYDIVIGDFPDYYIGDLVYVSNLSLTTGNYQLDTIPAIRRGGSDYIERNAKVFKQLIRTVNDSLSSNNSTNQLVVIGPSMGGLVSRIGLKEMENEGENHNVKLWVSFDSPHQGANVPLAFQYLVFHLNQYNHIINSLSIMDASSMIPQNLGIGALQRPAAKQMLIKHYLDDHVVNFNLTGSTNGAPGYRQRFDNYLNSLGYPNMLRKIAVVNGSFMGETNNMAGSEIANLHFWEISFPWGDILDATLHYENNSGLTNVIDFDYGATVSSYLNIDDISKFTQTNSNVGSFDSASGCYIELPSYHMELQNTDIVDGIFNLWITGYVNMDSSKFTFIPTKSTLDFQGANKLLRENLCSTYGNLSIQGLTPFDSYYAPVENEEHIKLTADNTNWLLQEIEGNQQDPYPDAGLCQTSLTIYGPTLLCPGDEFTYSTNVSTPVIWHTNGLTVINQDDYQITVRKNTSIGVANLTASASGFNSAHKNIICYPDIDIEHPNDNTIQLVTGNTDLPLSEQGITSVQWELLQGNGFFQYTDERNAEINSTDYYGQISVTNPKGTSSKIFFGPNPDKCYIIKKVDNDKYQVIDRCNGYTPMTTMPIKEIYDEFGNKIQDAPVVNDELDVSQSGQSGDIRIIRVVINGENISKIIVKD